MSRRGADDDPGRLAFELNGIILAADANFVLHDDPAVLDLARQVVRRRLRLSDGGSAAARRYYQAAAGPRTAGFPPGFP